MTQWTRCNCDELTKSRYDRQWEVVQRHPSPADGYYKTTELSIVRCKNCKAMWQTQAPYVDRLPDAPAYWWTKDT
jgi:hypothetical protein